MARNTLMKCRYCSKRTLIGRGKRGVKQRYQCKTCGKYQQNKYTYNLYQIKDDFRIKVLNAEGVGIRSMSRIMGYSPGTIMNRMMYLASHVTRPLYCESDQIYEVDEMWAYVGKNHPSNYCWITYAMNRKTRCIIDVAIGSRSKENLKKVIDSVKMHDPKKIVTDGLQTYPNLVKPTVHDTSRYSNNRIERGNLTLRTHVKRLFRKTICFSKSRKMLEACVLLYFDFRGWRFWVQK
jgi:insertion element IS1 protein InsB